MKSLDLTIWFVQKEKNTNNWRIRRKKKLILKASIFAVININGTSVKELHAEALTWQADMLSLHVLVWTITDESEWFTVAFQLLREIKKI